MKNYEVILTTTVDMHRDIDKDNPETKDHYFKVQANSPEEALRKVKSENRLCVWSSEVYED